MVPKKWVKFVVALFFIPLASILTKTLGLLVIKSLELGLLSTPLSLFFIGGIILWLLLFWLLPRSWFFFLYVYGHECTHALWAALFRGKVHPHFHVGKNGGHILTNKVNTWIILSPYFCPIYTLLVSSIYFISKLLNLTNSLEWIFFLLFGITFAFHLTFTLILITKKQPDFHYGGTLFSFLLVYSLNVIIISLVLIFLTPHLNLSYYWDSFSLSTIEVITIGNWILEKIQNF